LVDKKLIETELSKKGISVTTVEIDEEIKKIEAQVALQGRTLQEVLASEGITEQKVREQITTQKKLEKILADKIAVSPSEIDAFIKDSKTTLPKGAKMEDFRNQISDQLKQQKFQQEAQKWVAELTVNAKIKYYVNY
jgi:lambda repressor-like predicted transcriptional regulator